MNKHLAFAMALSCAGWIAAAPLAHGTDTYEYKRGETRVIDHGLSPDKQWSIAAGNNAKGDFHLFLVDAKSKKRIGPLEEAADALDTGAESLHAAWSPDSRHVVLTYRVSHQETVMWVYRVEDRRAFVVDGPKDLFPVVKDAKTGGEPLDPSHLSLEASWTSATRFTLHQESQYYHLSAKPGPALKPYVSDVEGSDLIDNGKKRMEYGFTFTADGDCELLAGDKYHVVSVKPAPTR